MSDKPIHLQVVASNGEGGGLADLRKSYEKGERHEPKAKAPRGGGPSKPPPPPSPPEPPDEDEIYPELLPPHSPVKALGVNGRTYYFLSSLGQFHQLMDKDINMNPILGLFGGDDEYLKTFWPKYAKGAKGRSEVVNFDHGMLRVVLIRSCNQAGIWSPEQNVRGVGTWAEEDGTLVMHCGDALFLNNGTRHTPGVRGRLLYPGAPAQPHPDFNGKAGPGGPYDVLLQKVETWNWARGKLDAELHCDWICAAMLGAAPPWRPIEWITGGSGCGKSTLMQGTRWVFGDRAMITSEDATPAGIKQRVADTCLTVSIDELESDKDTNRAADVMKLARIASSGGESLRGSPGGISMSFVSRNAFQFSSIVIPALPQQDKNRLFIGSLLKVEWDGGADKAKRTYEPGADYEEDEDEGDKDSENSVWGNKKDWVLVGRQLRGRLLAQWSRYAKTLRAYRKALEAAGHTARGQDQFGALGAAGDLARYDGFDPARALAFAAKLPAKTLDETSGYLSSHENCLAHLMGWQVEDWKGGQKLNVARLAHMARDEILNNVNDRSSAKMLESMGVKVGRDQRDASKWIIAISRTHTGLLKVFEKTDWKGIPGAPGPWAQMFARLEWAITTGKGGGPLRLHFAKMLNYAVALPWDVVFPPKSDDDDDDIMNEQDRDN